MIATRIVLALLISLASMKSMATVPSDSVVIDKLDIAYLEALVKEKIDSIRISHNLSQLGHDTMLYKVAIDHAIYLQNRKQMTHYQSSKMKRTALDRAKYYGVKNLRLVGENIVYNFMERMKVYDPNTNETMFYFSYTYEKLANDLVTTWMESKSHYETLKTPDWESTAVAVAFDPETKEIICVQVFADFQ